MTGGFIFTAPTSGAGKTVITLAVMRLLHRANITFSPAKSGPDYIDPQFHHLAAGRESVNLDAWAMTPDAITQIGPNPVIEGAMGFFDGAGLAGRGCSADLAEILDLPYILVLDAAKTAHSIAAVINGIITHRPHLRCAGVIFNRVGSQRHADMLRGACEAAHLPPVLGAIARDAALTLPERHLGLVQAGEIPHFDAWVDAAADTIANQLNMPALTQLLAQNAPQNTPAPLRPPAQRIAVANDIAFKFAYPHHLQGWRAAGAEITFFSPLGNDSIPDCDFVFLPGGYPELHAAQLSAAENFHTSLRQHAQTRPVYGECGGYMTLGAGLVDADGKRHKMAGLLDLETSFKQRKLHLGYRNAAPLHPPFPQQIKAHEFHYATTLRSNGPALFQTKDADGLSLPDQGLHKGHVYGSFLHIITGFPTFS